MSSAPEHDYLWDRSGSDPEIERLERLLSRFAAPTPAAGTSGARAGRRAAARWRRAGGVALAAGLLLAVGGWLALQWRLAWPQDAAWPVQALRGEVRIDGVAVVDAAPLAPGSEASTGPDGAATLRVARIGEARLAPATRVRLERSRAGGQRLRLLQGTLWSRIWAPPSHYGVGLHGSQVIDLGCEFLAHAEPDGSGWVSVRSGWVLVDGGTHEVLVPAGARVELGAGGVPGTPRDAAALPDFVDALRVLDAGAASGVADDAAIARLLAAARPEDAISVIALLARDRRLADGPLFDHLQRQWPAAAVDRAAVRAGDAQALDPWWRSLPYPRAKRWWLHWRDALPTAGPDWRAPPAADGG